MKTWVWVVLAAVLAGLAGEQVGKWRATAEHAEATQARAKEAQEDAAKILALSGSNAQLLLSIAAQNQAVAVAEAQSAAAQETARIAQEHAKDMAQLSESRMVKIEKALKEAKTVGEVLSRYWELRQ